MTDKEKAILSKWEKILPRLTDAQKEKVMTAADTLVLMTEYMPSEPPEKKSA